MAPLSPLDRFLAFAVAGGMFLSLSLWAAACTARFWKAPLERFARAKRAVQAAFLAGLLAATAIGGGKTNAPPQRLPPRNVREIPGSGLPAWFSDLGYPSADADGNGIPDCWERWTHTTGFAADSDPDGDGLSNLEEFEAGTDPICDDTDGDGLDDATELAGLAAGVPDMDPTVPATFAADEPDEDGDGIPDIWENDFIPVFFGVDPDGFPWGVDVPEATENNYDVTLTVTSSRHASLSWGAGQGESLLLPPCTNLAIRLRLSADAAKTVALSPSPDSATPPVGTWMASLSADWDWRRGLENENDRVALQDGTMVDRSGRESVATAAWLPLAGIRAGAPARGGRAQRNPSISFTPRKVELELENSFCPVHGPAPAVRVRGEGTSPPYIWIEHGEGIETQSDRYVPTRPHPDGRFVVTVRWSDGHEGLFVEDKAIVAPTPCRPGRTNFVGAAWSSTHDPADPSDHAPGVEEVETHFGPLCPVARDTNVRAGWTHDTGKLWIRNLVRILTGDPQDDETDHCIGLPYDSSEVIDLWSFLSDVCTPYRDRFVFKVNGFPIQGHIVKMSDFATSDDLKPRVLHISFSLDDSREMDRMWVVLYSTNLASSYNAWKNRFTNTAWTTKLPAVPSSIGLVSNDSGSVFVDSSRTYPGWRSPTRISSLLHHDAIYEMRSEPVGQHGHQATYRKDGTLISTTISAGTADYFHPLSFRFSWSNFVVERHYVDDVIPFLRAVSLDGNPGAYNSRYVPTDLSHPCLYQGQNLDDYISRRPTLPTGTRQ